MNNKFEIKDILVAVDEILDNKEELIKKYNNTSKNNILLLNNEVKIKSSKDDVPLNTEKIILEAEKYLKK